MTSARFASADAQRGGIISRFLFLVFLVALAFVLYLVRRPLLRFTGGLLIEDDSPRASDAIVVLGDDNYGGDRATKAAELIKAGWSPRVIASGRYLRSYASIADLERHDLIDRGVPASAIVPFPSHAENTREECTAIGELIGARKWKHFLVVTSNYHTRRADFICSRLLPEGTDLHVVAAPDAEYNTSNWWHSRKGVKIFLHEVGGFIVAAWELRHNSVQTTASIW